MLVLFLAFLALSALLGVVVLFVLQYRALEKGEVVFSEEYSGPRQVEQALTVLIRYFLKRSIHFRKFCTQYVLHIMVRCMYYVDIFTSYLYAKSRNWFVQNAVKNKGTVSHFWEHLKVYKQEMDKEKTDLD